MIIFETDLIKGVFYYFFDFQCVDMVRRIKKQFFFQKKATFFQPFRIDVCKGCKKMHSFIWT
jgi:hypothetical protein